MRIPAHLRPASFILSYPLDGREIQIFVDGR